MSALITIDGKTYELKPVASPEKRRLILSLTRFFEWHEKPLESDDHFLSRVEAFKTVFAHVFPDAPKFREVTCMFADFSEWKFVLPDAKPEHINWAKTAEACRLIDSFLVDYGE